MATQAQPSATGHTPSAAPPMPKKLYKYRPFNTRTLRMLTQAEVYYSDPRNFNDPMDCDPPVKLDIDRPSLKRLCADWLRTTKGEKAARERIADLRYSATEPNDDGSDTDEELQLDWLLKDELKTCLDEELRSKGVFSVSETWASPLMWSHYADEHRGLCIEYDTTELDHPELKRVNYRAPRSVSAKELFRWKVDGSADGERAVHDAYFFAKSSQWKYEKEWRDITGHSGSAMSRFRITGVLFGFRCDQAVITSIVHLLNGVAGISFYAVHPFRNTFQLTKRPVEVNEVLAMGIRQSAAFVFKDVSLPE